jgi:integrase
MWRAVISEGNVAADGRVKRRRRYFYGATALAARSARDKYLAETTGKAPAPEPDPTTLAELSQAFLDHVERNNRANTHRSYEQVLRLHILPALGKLPLAELTPAHVKSAYESISKKASPSMAARSHTTLRAMLNFGREEHAIESSPLDRMKRSAPRHRRERVESLAEKQVAALLKAAKGTRLEALFVLAITTGMRQGELFALRWSDVDLAHRALSVEVPADTGYVLARPADDAGHRRERFRRHPSEAPEPEKGMMAAPGGAHLGCTWLYNEFGEVGPVK